MLNIVLFGPPGAGKGTQSEKLIKKFGFVHISTGDLFRWHKENQTELGKKVTEMIDNGILVPDEITIAMLKGELDKNPDAKGFLFDGFPRTVAQAQALDQFMADNKTAIHHIVALDVPESEVRARIAKRKEIENRVDDQADKLEKRINEYFSKTIHVLPYYKEHGRLNTINGIGEVEDIYENICAVMH